jgi:hypothetical protein
LITKTRKIKPAIAPSQPPRQRVQREETINIAPIRDKPILIKIFFHPHAARLKKSGIKKVRYEDKPLGFLNGPVGAAEKPPEALPLRNSNPRSFCVKTDNPTNVELNKSTPIALPIRLVSLKVSIIAQRRSGNLPHFTSKTFRLLTAKGPLLIMDKPIKTKNIRSNPNNTLFDFMLEKSGDIICLRRKKVSTNPAKEPIIAIEMGIKNISP